MGGSFHPSQPGPRTEQLLALVTRYASQMLALTPSPASYIRIRASGRLTAADYRRFESAFAAELKRRDLPIPLLLDMRGFRGWTPAAFLRDLSWDLRNRRTFSKIAVVGDRPWHRWITAAGAPLFRAPMKFFRDASDAEAWLRRQSVKPH